MNLTAYSRVFSSVSPSAAPGGTMGIRLRMEGVQSMVDSLRRFSAGLQPTADRTDRLLAIATTVAMRAKAPSETGRLKRGITWTNEKGQFFIRASAIGEAMSTADYAPFQEYGTESMDASPFFWDTARMVLGDRVKLHERSVEDLARKSGFHSTVNSMAREFGEGVMLAMADDLFSLFGE